MGLDIYPAHLISFHRCYTCNGHRTENCHKCMGRKRLVRYKVVTVKWWVFVPAKKWICEAISTFLINIFERFDFKGNEHIRTRIRYSRNTAIKIVDLSRKTDILQRKRKIEWFVFERYPSRRNPGYRQKISCTASKAIQNYYKTGKWRWDIRYYQSHLNKIISFIL